MDVLLDTCTGRRAVRCLLRCLLLLHLFSMKAAADCPKPQEGANIVLTNAALLLNAFPEGLEVTLECGHGFVKESGSEIITCLHGIWTELALKCKKKDCGDPKPQPHMSFNISSGTLFGDTIKVICDKGFEISGSAYRTCYANGWSGRGTTCEIVTCNKPVNVINGKSSWDSQEYPKYGEIIQYFCNMGYVLIGNDNLVCSDTGEYDSQPPTCEGQTREDLRITATMATPTPPPKGQTTEDLRITTTMATPTPPPQGQTIEDLRITTTMATPTPPPQEAPTSTDSPATPTPTAHRDTSVTTSVTPTVSPSLPGGRGIWTVEGTATTTSVTSMTSSSFPGEYDEALDTNKGIGYSLVIVGLIAAIFVLLVAGIALWKFILRRKGSVNGTAPIY